MARKRLTLQDVARAAADKNGGKGGRGLQRLADSKGLTLSYATVDRILAGKYESTPQKQTIEALAVLAEMPLGEVYEAAGLPLPMTSFAEQLPDGSDQLTVHQRRVVLDVIRGFIRDNDRMAELEDQRDERVPGRNTLLKWANERDDAALETMGLEELYEMLEVLGRAVPTMDETDLLVAYAARAGEILERRENDQAAVGGSVVEDPAQPNGITPNAGADQEPSDRMPIDPNLTGSGRYNWSSDMPAEELYPLIGELAAQRDDQTAPKPLRQQAGQRLETLLSHLAEQHAQSTARAKDTNLGRSDAGPNAYLPQRGSENEGPRDHRPWEQDEYGLAAKRGRNRGREARAQQDHDAEGGGA